MVLFLSANAAAEEKDNLLILSVEVKHLWNVFNMLVFGINSVVELYCPARQSFVFVIKAFSIQDNVIALFQWIWCPYLQWKTWRSGELQISNLTAPQWQPPWCFTRSICRSKENNKSQWRIHVSLWVYILECVWQEATGRNKPVLVKQVWLFCFETWWRGTEQPALNCSNDPHQPW